MARLRDFANYCVRDKDGIIVLGQPANPPIIVAVIAALLTAITRGVFQELFGLVAFGAFFTWAWLELFDGATPLRRVLGALTLGALLAVGTYVLQTMIR